MLFGIDAELIEDTTINDDKMMILKNFFTGYLLYGNDLYKIYHSEELYLVNFYTIIVLNESPVKPRSPPC